MRGSMICLTITYPFGLSSERLVRPVVSVSFGDGEVGCLPYIEKGLDSCRVLGRLHNVSISVYRGRLTSTILQAR